MSDRVRLGDLTRGAGALHVDGSAQPLAPLVVVDLDDVDWADHATLAAAVHGLTARTPVLLGIASTSLPDEAAPLLEGFTLTLAPGGPGRTWVHDDSAHDVIAETVVAAPNASVTLAGLLPVTSNSSVADGLVVESLAYSMLLAGPEFRAWRERTSIRPVPESDEPVLLARDGETLSIVLNRPDRHNAFGRAVRDGLLNGLEVAARDPDIHQVLLTGRGRSFCSGGDLDEFGSTPNVTSAHLVRLEQSAGFAVHQLRDRVRVVLHGACIGAGVEVPAFAGRVEANDDAWFMLPELSMGLVPGAGGTVSITHRIGRWRTAYMALTGRRIDRDTALAWGLVDARA